MVSGAPCAPSVAHSQARPEREVALELGHLEPVEVEEHEPVGVDQHAARGEVAVAEHLPPGALVVLPGAVDREGRLDEGVEHGARRQGVGRDLGDRAAHRPGQTRPVADPLDDHPAAVEVGQQVADLHGAGVRGRSAASVTEAGSRDPGHRELTAAGVEPQRLRHPGPAASSAAQPGGPQARHRRMQGGALGARVALDHHSRPMATLVPHRPRREGQGAAGGGLVCHD